MTAGKKIAGIVTAASLALGMGVIAAPAAQARTHFASCDQMHKSYQYGISKSSAAASRAYRDGEYRPAVRPSVYADSYKTLDRDKDGSMCEIPR